MSYNSNAAIDQRPEYTRVMPCVICCDIKQKHEVKGFYVNKALYFACNTHRAPWYDVMQRLQETGVTKGTYRVEHGRTRGWCIDTDGFIIF